jgi:hypothetical protein
MVPRPPSREPFQLGPTSCFWNLVLKNPIAIEAMPFDGRGWRETELAYLNPPATSLTAATAEI